MELKTGKLYCFYNPSEFAAHWKDVPGTASSNFITLWKNAPGEEIKEVAYENILFYVKAQKWVGQAYILYYLFLDKDGDKLWLSIGEVNFLKEVNGT